MTRYLSLALRAVLFVILSQLLVLSAFKNISYAAPIFSEDFTNGDKTGDPEWTVLKGKWRVPRAKVYSPAKNKLSLSQATGISLNTSNSYTIQTKIKLTRKYLRFANGSLLAAVQDKNNYLYLMVKKSKFILGKKGSFAGEGGGVKGKIKRRFKPNKWYTIALSISSDGTVAAFVDDLVTPLITHQMPLGTNPGGGVGVLAKKAKTLFDDYLVDEQVSGGSGDPGGGDPDGGDPGGGDPGGGDPTPTPVAVTAPSQLKALTASHTAVAVTWKDNSNNEDGFKVEKSTSCSSGFTQAVAVAANSNTAQVGGLAPNTTYCFRVRAYKGTTNSSYSGTAQAKTNQNPALLPAPSNLTAAVQSHEAVKVDWNDNSGDEDGFKVEASKETGGACNAYAVVGQVGAGIKTFTVGALTPNTSYCFRVRAFKGDLLSNASNMVKKITQSTAGGPPIGKVTLTAQAVSSSSVQLTWTNVQNETAYAVYLFYPGIPGDNWTFQYNVAADATTTTLASLPTTECWFGVIAWNANGQVNSNDYVVNLAANKGTIQVVNYSGYKILQVKINGVSKLDPNDPNDVVPPSSSTQEAYWYDHFAPGTYTVVAQVGRNKAAGWMFESVATHTVADGGNSRHYVTVGDLLKGPQGFFGVQWNTEPWTEHKLVFTANPKSGVTSFSRQIRTGGGWAPAGSGVLSGVSWPVLAGEGPIVSFHLGAGGAYSSISYPFQDLMSNIAVGGGSQLLDRQ